MLNDARLDLEYALRFTETYRQAHEKFAREVACLRMQLPYVLEPIGDDDLVVGVMRHGFVGFSPQHGGVYTYYFHDDRVARALAEINADAGANADADDAFAARVEAMRVFWKTEATTNKVEARFREQFPQGIRSSCYYAANRIAGMNVDLGLLVRAGLCGLKARNDEARRERAQGDDSGSPFLDALDSALDLLAETCLRYAAEADALEKTAAPARAAELAEIAGNFRHIAAEPPRTFKQGLQLIWIYAAASDLMNYGRMDAHLGDLYAADIAAGRITETEAIRWLSSLFRNIIKVGKIHDSRIIVGGLGRDNPAAADSLALALIKTARAVVDVVPQLTVRYHRGLDPRIMDETLANIEAGAVYPIVYSDETVVPSVEKSYGIDRAAACAWVPFGCGEYVLEGCGAATPNTGVVLPQLLDLLLHQGRNSFTGRLEIAGIPTPETFATFEDLFAAYDRVLREICAEMAVHEQLNYDVAGEEAGHLFLSLLIHDCVETDRPIFSGGCRYLAATSEVFGLITCADSLAAIKHCVYDKRLFTLPHLVRACDANFDGYARERQQLLRAPKYGNDDDEGDAMALRVFHHSADCHEAALPLTRLYRYKMCSVNNSGSAERGAVTSATPDGRLRGAAFSNGNTPAPGADTQGLTATLNSMSKFDASRHVGVVHNLRFNRTLLRENRAAIRAVLETFFEHNGVQANLSSIGAEDLQQALLHPENYRNLIVRIGGFSARFIELPAIVQNELIARTTYEAL